MTDFNNNDTNQSNTDSQDDPLQGYSIDPNTGDILSPHHNVGDSSTSAANIGNQGTNTSGQQTGGVVSGEMKTYQDEATSDTTNASDSDDNLKEENNIAAAGERESTSFVVDPDKDPLLAKADDQDMVVDGQNIGDIPADDMTDQRSAPI